MNLTIDEKIQKICKWLEVYSDKTNTKGFVVGVSGGIDSALVSNLCALTNRKTIVVNLPINTNLQQNFAAKKHMDQLCKIFSNVEQRTLDLSKTFENFKNDVNCINELALANCQSRLRMMALYSISNKENFLVVGTGNKIEDYGIGFFTKYGDGGVDISPIADLLKSEVYSLAKKLNIAEEILLAAPTDGLWEDGRNDESQIGASYEELEWAMSVHKNDCCLELSELSGRKKEVYEIFINRHNLNKHKMELIPICKMD